MTITVGYWSIKGLAAPLRMMTMYNGEQLHNKMYDIKAKEGGGWNNSEWSTAKPDLRRLDPFINLPYIQDGEKIISQSNACMLYLGRKFDMLGCNSDELSACEVLLCEIMDLRNALTTFCYDTTNNPASAQALFNKVTSVHGSLAKIESWLQIQTAKGHSGTFLVGDKASAPDFHLWEMLDQYQGLTKYFKLTSSQGSESEGLLAHFPALNHFYTSFAALPQNQKYLTSPLYTKLPYNNKMAYFGATVSGDMYDAKVHANEDYGQYSGLF